MPKFFFWAGRHDKSKLAEGLSHVVTHCGGTFWVACSEFVRTVEVVDNDDGSKIT